MLSQFLSFTLGNDDYGIDILRVQEIRGWEEVRKIPNTPDYIKGVMNLRNTVVPIVDLRIRFGLENIEYLPTTVIIVLSVELAGEQHVMGVVVDAVSDVIDVNDDEIRKSPNFGATVDTKYINGMVMLGKRMVILLNTEKLLNPRELLALAEMSE
jgi:purine-binding chemotaxis protein CheW